MDDTTPSNRGTGTGRQSRPDPTDRIAEQRESLKTRHATALSRLLAERSDLRGTYAFADFVEESLRWTA